MWRWLGPSRAAPCWCCCPFSSRTCWHRRSQRSGVACGSARVSARFPARRDRPHLPRGVRAGRDRLARREGRRRPLGARHRAPLGRAAVYRRQLRAVRAHDLARADFRPRPPRPRRQAGADRQLRRAGSARDAQRADCGGEIRRMAGRDADSGLPPADRGARLPALDAARAAARPPAVARRGVPARRQQRARRLRARAGRGRDHRRLRLRRRLRAARACSRRCRSASRPACSSSCPRSGR